MTSWTLPFRRLRLRATASGAKPAERSESDPAGPPENRATLPSTNPLPPSRPYEAVGNPRIPYGLVRCAEAKGIRMRTLGVRRAFALLTIRLMGESWVPCLHRLCGASMSAVTDPPSRESVRESRGELKSAWFTCLPRKSGASMAPGGERRSTVNVVEAMTPELI